MSNPLKILLQHKFLSLSLLIFLLIPIAIVESQEEKRKKQPFALVELFTSQGCSSCPPADAYLQKLTHLAQLNNQRIFTLSFHVDYWNYIGWKDPYSQAAFTKRQRQYAKAFKENTVFTPQLLVNGQNPIIGSDINQIKLKIDHALKKASKTIIEVKDITQKDDLIHINFNTSNLGKQDVIHVALIQNASSNIVTDGENSGKTLSHVNIVRSFKTIKPAGLTHSLNITKPKDLMKANARILIYSQNLKTMHITGAELVEI